MSQSFSWRLKCVPKKCVLKNSRSCGKQPKKHVCLTLAVMKLVRQLRSRQDWDINDIHNNSLKMVAKNDGKNPRSNFVISILLPRRRCELAMGRVSELLWVQGAARRHDSCSDWASILKQSPIRVFGSDWEKRDPSKKCEFDTRLPSKWPNLKYDVVIFYGNLFQLVLNQQNSS